MNIFASNNNNILFVSTVTQQSEYLMYMAQVALITILGQLDKANLLISENSKNVFSTTKI